MWRVLCQREVRGPWVKKHIQMNSSPKHRSNVNFSFEMKLVATESTGNLLHQNQRENRSSYTPECQLNQRSTLWPKQGLIMKDSDGQCLNEASGLPAASHAGARTRCIKAKIYKSSARNYGYRLPHHRFGKSQAERIVQCAISNYAKGWICRL